MFFKHALGWFDNFDTSLRQDDENLLLYCDYAVQQEVFLMKESTAEARKRQIYGLRKRRRRKKRLKICACILMLLFLGVGVVRSAMSLIGILKQSWMRDVRSLLMWVPETLRIPVILWRSQDMTAKALQSMIPTAGLTVRNTGPMHKCMDRFVICGPCIYKEPY